MSSSYQPSAAELRATLRIDMTKEELGEWLMRPVRIRTIEKSKQGR